MKIAIDGHRLSGLYRVDCECGDTWRGEGERLPELAFSPALPIAECVAHFRLCHEEKLLEVRFSEKFSQWLVSHWEHVLFRMAHEVSLPFPTELTVGRR